MLDKAIDRDAAAEFVRLAHFVDGKPRIKDDPPLIYHPDEVEDPAFHEVVTENLARYRESLAPERRVLFDRYELADIAVKVVGVGSVGTLCAIALFFAAEDDILFLQVKQVAPSVLEPYVGLTPFARTASASSSGSASCRRPATCFWATWSASAGGTSTSASCAT